MKKYGFLCACACVVLAGCGARTQDDVATAVRTAPSEDATVFDCHGQEMRMDVLRDPVRAQIFFTGRTHEPIVLDVASSDDATTTYTGNSVTLVAHDDDTTTLSIAGNTASVTCTPKK